MRVHVNRNLHISFLTNELIDENATVCICDGSRIKCTYHREIDIRGIEFHVDLLVDQRLAVLVVVLPDLGHGHLDRLVGLGVGELKKGKV